MKTKLQEIAAGMRRAVEQKSVCWTEFTLSGGLRLILSRNEERYVLSLRREGVFPSLQELEIVMRAFGVPEGTEPSRRQLTDNKSAGRTIRWFIVDLAWREVAVARGQAAGVRGQVVAAG